MQHLGDSIYGTGTTTLEERLVQLLERSRERICFLEAGSGGGLAARFGSADGHERVLRGAWFAPTEEGLGRLLGVADDGEPNDASPREKLVRLVAKAAEGSQNEWVLAVGESWQQDDARFVTVVLRSPDGELRSQAVRLRGSDESSRARLATTLFDQLRRSLE